MLYMFKSFVSLLFRHDSYISYTCYLIVNEEFYFLCQLQYTVRSVFIAHINDAVGKVKLKTATQMSINLIGVLV